MPFHKSGEAWRQRSSTCGLEGAHRAADLIVRLVGEERLTIEHELLKAG
jgi:hypothetical protein